MLEPAPAPAPAEFPVPYQLRVLEHYRDDATSRAPFRLAGVGLREWMRPGIVNRPGGTRDWLLMYFHDPVSIELGGVMRPLGAGALMLWDERAGHVYGHASAPWCHSWIHCHGRVLPQLLQGLGLAPGLHPDLALDPLLDRWLPLLYHERVRPAGADPIILENLFHCLLREIARVRSPGATRIPPGIQRVRHYLHQHLEEPIRLATLCELAAMSRPHLIAEFKRCTGLPPVTYLIRLRCDHARYLLLNRNLTVADVAARVGYPDVYHFSKLFKKHVGLPPSAIRQPR